MSEEERLVVYGSGSHALAQFAACPRGTPPVTFALLKACLATIRRQRLKPPTERRQLVFTPDGSEFLGYWPASSPNHPTRAAVRKYREAIDERPFHPRPSHENGPDGVGRPDVPPGPVTAQDCDRARVETASTPEAAP